MYNNSSIEWTNIAHSFWVGNHIISSGSKNKNIKGNKIKKMPASKFYKPQEMEMPKRILTCPYSDFFIEEADLWRPAAWKVIKNTPQHTWVIITERPERIKKNLPPDWGEYYPNVVFGVSISEQMYFDRAEILSKVPVKTRLIYASPLLEHLNLLESRNGKRIIDSFDWVILEGESSNLIKLNENRLSKLTWFEEIIFELKMNTKVAVFVIGLGIRLSKKLGYIEKNGCLINEWPVYVQFREIPN